MTVCVRSLLAASILGALVHVQSQCTPPQITRTDGASSLWTTASQWKQVESGDFRVPQITDLVYIGNYNSGGTVATNPAVSIAPGVAFASELVIDDGGDLIIDDGADLTIGGDCQDPTLSPTSSPTMLGATNSPTALPTSPTKAPTTLGASGSSAPTTPGGTGVDLGCAQNVTIGDPALLAQAVSVQSCADAGDPEIGGVVPPSEDGVDLISPVVIVKLFDKDGKPIPVTNLNPGEEIRFMIPVSGGEENKLGNLNERELACSETALACEFWDPISKDWSQKGCSVTPPPLGAKEAECVCNHLTAFALVLREANNGGATCAMKAHSFVNLAFYFIVATIATIQLIRTGAATLPLCKDILRVQHLLIITVCFFRIVVIALSNAFYGTPGVIVLLCIFQIYSPCNLLLIVFTAFSSTGHLSNVCHVRVAGRPMGQDRPFYSRSKCSGQAGLDQQDRPRCHARCHFGLSHPVVCL